MIFKISAKMKNVSIDPKIKSFVAKYLDDGSCPFKAKGLKVKTNVNLLEISSHNPQD